jgi:L,D-peptidoglycan transpeptidase YkuD (ErfK/YbiS/YcfS/YnhG family)
MGLQGPAHLELLEARRTPGRVDTYVMMTTTFCSRANYRRHEVRRLSRALDVANQPGKMMTSLKLRLLCIFVIPICPISGAFARSSRGNSLSSSTQIVVVTTADWNAVEGTLQRYERNNVRQGWTPVGESFAVAVGKNGLGWGAGVAPSDASIRGADDPVKKEGDGKAPAGIFRLSTAFGYATEPQAGWHMPYISLTPTVECVDDTASKSYNRVVDNTKVAVDWNSSEHMLRSDELYRWGLVVDHNADPVTPGAGSCIFMHIWRGPGRGTVGCTAMPQEKLESVIGWLDATRKPLLVQLPLAQYENLKKRWRLPDLPQADQH